MKITKEERHRQEKKLLGSNIRLQIIAFGVISFVFLIFIIAFPIGFKHDSKRDLTGLIILEFPLLVMFLLSLFGMMRQVDEYKDFSYEFDYHKKRPKKENKTFEMLLLYFKLRQIPFAVGFVCILMGLMGIFPDWGYNQTERIIFSSLGFMGLIIYIMLVTRSFILFLDVRRNRIVSFSADLKQIEPITIKYKGGKEIIGERILITKKGKETSLIYLFPRGNDNCTQDFSFPVRIKGTYYKHSRIIDQIDLINVSNRNEKR